MVFDCGLFGFVDGYDGYFGSSGVGGGLVSK